MFSRFPHYAALALCMAWPLAAARAETAQQSSPRQLLDGLAQEARAAQPGFGSFSAQRGDTLFHEKHGGEWSCASCHTDDPRRTGRHARTGRSIAPMAPAVNAERFTDAAKVAKWFKRNCHDVFGRACSAQEKGDLLAYLLAQRP